MTTTAEAARIRALLQRVFEGEAWHGPPILHVLTQLDYSAAVARPVQGANSIWEIVNHVTSWLTIVRRRAEGETVSEIDPATDWPPSQDGSAAAWDAARERMRASYEDLSTCLARLDDDRLEDRIQGKLREYSVYDDLHGVSSTASITSGRLRS